MLWDLLLINSHSIKGLKETATRRDFVNSKIKHEWSILGKSCRDSEWLPNADGIFHKPDALFLTDLPEGFEKDTAKAKSLAETLGMKKPELQQLAEKLGVAIEGIEIIQQNPDSFKRWIEKEKEAAAKSTEPSTQSAAGAGSDKIISSDDKSTAGSNGRPRTGQEGNKSEGQRSRLLSYVLPKVNPDASEKDEEDDESAASDSRENINRAGVDRVLEWEAQAGRYPEEMSHTHPGYDVESKNEDGEVVRYIEVKSRAGSWDNQGVTLSDTQFYEAQKRKDSYWLYIVEKAEQDDAQMYRIQDPASHVDYFCYDSGWRGLSE